MVYTVQVIISPIASLKLQESHVHASEYGFAISDRGSKKRHTA